MQMNKTPLFTILTLAVSVFFVTGQALAGPASVTTLAKQTPGPQHTPGAQATAHAGSQSCHGKHQNYRGTIASVSSSSLALTLSDGSSATFAVTSDTRIKIPGPNGSSASLQTGMQAMVQAVADSSSNLTACSVMAIPGQPMRVHRVGWVTEYTPGVSITIQASDGNFYTFSLTADTKILPAERAGELAVGSRVTIIAPRDPGALGWTALGIVVHPAGSGAGSMPPTVTPTVIPSATPTP
jgi:uncharacterized protein DUF5666